MIYVAIVFYLAVGLMYGILGWAQVENVGVGLLFALFLLVAWPLFGVYCLFAFVADEVKWKLRNK